MNKLVFHLARAGLLLILLAAFFLRFNGLNYGLADHLVIYYDPASLIDMANKILDGNFQPQGWFWAHSPLWAYVLAFAFKTWAFLANSAPRLASLLNRFLLGGVEPAMIQFSLDRLLGACLGTATVGVIYLAARQLYDRSVAWLAALFLALNYLHIYWSHLGLNDVPMVFGVVLTFYFCCRIYETGRWPDYLAAGLLAGLTATAKINGLPVVFSLFIAHLGFVARCSAKKSFWAGLWPLLAALLASCLVYGLCCYYFFLDHQWAAGVINSLSHRQSVGRLYSQDATATGLPVNSILEYGRIFFFYLGWPLAVFFLLSLGYQLLRLRKDLWRILLLLNFPLLYFFALSQGSIVWTKHLLAIFPFLGLSGAVFWQAIVRTRKPAWLAQPGPLRSAAVGLFFLLLLGPGLLKTGELTWLLWQKDTRTEAGRWVEQNIPRRKKLLITGYSAAINRQDYDIKNIGWQTALTDIKNGGFDYVIISSLYTGRFLGRPDLYPNQKQFYEQLDRELVLAKRFAKKQLEFMDPEIKIYRVPKDLN